MIGISYGSNVIFFRKNFVGLKTCCTFAATVPAKPLNNAQIGGAFYFISL